MLRRTLLSRTVGRNALLVVEDPWNRRKQSRGNASGNQSLRNVREITSARRRRDDIESECSRQERKRIDDEHRVKGMTFDGRIALHALRRCKRGAGRDSAGAACDRERVPAYRR